ncbi:hypothetical protein BD408DRAFT_435633 [Parasitella parasitica]|nr:hypothetical protein BD408DRAFT_435633 [Parasitella parasitica]
MKMDKDMLLMKTELSPWILLLTRSYSLIETISFRTQFLANKPPERPHNPVMRAVADERSCEDVYMEQCYTVYPDEDKTRFFHLFFSKCLNASTVARQLGIHVRAAQRWVKRYYEDPESIFAKKKSGRRRILGEEHKQFGLNYSDENPSSAVVTEVAESLTQNFADLKCFSLHHL